MSVIIRRSALDAFYPEVSEKNFFEAVIDITYQSQVLFDEQKLDLALWVLKCLAMPEVKFAIGLSARARLGDSVILMYSPTSVREQYRALQKTFGG